jgi:hypothetical protein
MPLIWREFLLIPALLLADSAVPIALFLSSGNFAAPSVPPEDVLKDLRARPPRFYLVKEEFPRIQAAIRNDTVVRHWYKALEAQAQKTLAEPPVKRELLGSRTPQMLARARWHATGEWSL